MLKAYQQQDGGLNGVVVTEDAPLPAGAVWLDLLNPTPDERRKVDNSLAMEMPTRADMEEIEISSRLYQEDGGLFMTAAVLTQTDTDLPISGAITFVLTEEWLVTIRYIDPQPFRSYALRCERAAVTASSPENVLLQLLDAIVDRMADILEKTGADVEAISLEIFEPTQTLGHRSDKDFQNVLQNLGRKYDLTSKMRESLLTLSRILTFLNQAFDATVKNAAKVHVKTISRDVASLQDHSTYLSGKLTFLLDATLGLINIEQNTVIKTMSVAAIVLLPPTLLASIWGMNYQTMPELDWTLGYPLALAAMVVAGVLPYLFFRRRGWL
ncbi:MAG: magnesium transporter CorA family protein [Micropepsaceae bacterium]